MKERPILFSAPMVRAILDGRKTQTRRIVKNPEWTGCLTGDCPHERQAECDVALVALSPYGAPGDRLWVRETCIGEELEDGTDGVRYLADGHFQPIDNTPRASIDWLKLHTYRGHKGGRLGSKVVAIHMPRWASRITLEITAVRLERLNDCSEADAEAEGVQACARRVVGLPGGCDSFLCGYRQLWSEINGKGSWEANPWVWVVAFRHIAQEERAA